LNVYSLCEIHDNFSLFLSLYNKFCCVNLVYFICTEACFIAKHTYGSMNITETSLNHISKRRAKPSFICIFTFDFFWEFTSFSMYILINVMQYFHYNMKDTDIHPQRYMQKLHMANIDSWTKTSPEGRLSDQEKGSPPFLDYLDWDKMDWMGGGWERKIHEMIQKMGENKCEDWGERVTRIMMKVGGQKEWSDGINGETVKTEWVKRESRYLSVVGGLRKRLTPLRSGHCSRGGTLWGVPSCAAPPQPGVMTSSPEDSIRLFPLDFLFPLCLLNLHESPALLNWMHALENLSQI